MKVVVVMADDTSIREAVGGIGYFIKVHDIDGLFECIVYILEHKNEINLLRKQGVAYASKYNWQLTVDKTVALYQELLS
ncbi:hypothetical protein KJ830_08330 [bacterium]|nr:hypothetical protein [bacterium]MBU4511037.1 hypothetical protein [bacterium]